MVGLLWCCETTLVCGLLFMVYCCSIRNAILIACFSILVLFYFTERPDRLKSILFHFSNPTFFSLFCNTIPHTVNPIKAVLNIKCCGHESCWMIPPQLQGKFSSISRIAATYPVNRIIKANDAYKP